MLTVDEALREVLTRAVPLPPRTRAILDALGCHLAEDVQADLDLPPFDKALVDGYALRAGDFKAQGDRFTVGEEILAGQTPQRPLAPGEVAAIMTGAPLPDGADAVVMIERTERFDQSVAIHENAVRVGMNILRRGRELREGETVLQQGERLNPARIGLLASVGRTSVQVVPRPVVQVVPTGDELVEPGQKPGPGQIRNSNALMLAALITNAGAEARIGPIARDNPEALAQELRSGLKSDALIITGGVSAGNRDLVPETLEALGVERRFHKVRIRPGKPLWFGVGPARGSEPGPLVFGLPGNPVSGFVSFQLFVRPALIALMGGSASPNFVRRFPLAVRFRHQGDRPTYHPARRLRSEAGDTLLPLNWAGSADLRTVASADGFAVFPAGDHEYVEGDVVDFLDLD